jgi:hypothetical protein
MALTGLVSSEHSTGLSAHRGDITRAGNRHRRAQLVEAAWSYQHRPRVGATIAARHRGVEPAVAARAWAAQVRLTTRFRQLATRKNIRSIVAGAVARELAGFGGPRGPRTSRPPDMTTLGHPAIGAGLFEYSTTRRDTAAAGSIPAGNPTTTGNGATDAQILGHPPAQRRTAIPTREHHCGGAPIHDVPARPRALGRPPPPPLRGPT